ncbi:hypothetical protein MGYG_07296 [Nannizzia gypsea CBS 118893]|uniref:Pyoverdine/dityrosine biosynthesis protein n=1 Tax=Arthroderma gypseum (strain ATCC MYA-4604 / CBS 118893) TaxID=535722 RepID=E4V2M2_ARTGP|nr:hypothetical protein MGYG_07296 [Nannizzia gypsea CBS 118893]EFR04287.1 hypothetical protein MGYG_07296 [Nannizzia gypsea CBS 118893]
MPSSQPETRHEELAFRNVKTVSISDEKVQPEIVAVQEPVSEPDQPVDAPNDEEDDVHRQTAERILAVLEQYLLPKAPDAHDGWAQGAPKFITVIRKFVKDGKAVQMCLPAFPWKSANTAYRVLGKLPDKGEEVALKRLNAICEDIGNIYKPGAKMLIVTAGLVYNDLLSITDREVWAYSEALRSLAKLSGCTHLSFTHPKDLVHIPGLPAKVEEMVYVANASNFRRALLNKFSNPKLDVATEIVEQEDTRLIYCAYTQLLENDLRYMYNLDEHKNGLRYRDDVKFLARQLIIRGDTLAAAIRDKFPDHLRLSVHQSTGEHMVSINLLPTSTTYTIPWQCSVAYLADGSLISGPRAIFEDNPKFELGREKNGRPSYFKEKAVKVGTNGLERK